MDMLKKTIFHTRKFKILIRTIMNIEKNHKNNVCYYKAQLQRSEMVSMMHLHVKEEMCHC